MSFLSALLRRFIIPLAILGSGVVLMNLVIASGPDTSLDAETTPADERPIVLTTQPSVQSVNPQVMAWAEIKAAQQVDLTAPSNQRVTDVLVSLGQNVVEGQLLVLLDDRQLQTQITQVNAQIDSINAQIASSEQRFRSDRELLAQEQTLVEAAQRELERQRTLAGNNLSTAAQIEQSENTLAQRQTSFAQRQLAVNNQANDRAQLQAQRTQLEAQLSALQLQLQDLQLRAPFDGQISRLDARQGERASNQPLVRVQSQGRELQAWVAAERLQSDVVSATTLNGDWLSDTIYKANELRSGAIEIRFTSQLPGLMPGQQHRIVFDLQPVNALLLPESSLYPGDQVFVINDGLLQAVDVNLLGRRWQDNQAWILIENNSNLQNPILVTRLNEASTGLAVKLAQEN